MPELPQTDRSPVKTLVGTMELTKDARLQTKIAYFNNAIDRLLEGKNEARKYELNEISNFLNVAVQQTNFLKPEELDTVNEALKNKYNIKITLTEAPKLEEKPAPDAPPAPGTPPKAPAEPAQAQTPPPIAMLGVFQEFMTDISDFLGPDDSDQPTQGIDQSPPAEPQSKPTQDAPLPEPSTPPTQTENNPTAVPNVSQTSIEPSSVKKIKLERNKVNETTILEALNQPEAIKDIIAKLWIEKQKKDPVESITVEEVFSILKEEVFGTKPSNQPRALKNLFEDPQKGPVLIRKLIKSLNIEGLIRFVEVGMAKKMAEGTLEPIIKEPKTPAPAATSPTEPSVATSVVTEPSAARSTTEPKTTPTEPPAPSDRPLAASATEPSAPSDPMPSATRSPTEPVTKVTETPEKTDQKPLIMRPQDVNEDNVFKALNQRSEIKKIAIELLEEKQKEGSIEPLAIEVFRKLKARVFGDRQNLQARALINFLAEKPTIDKLIERLNIETIIWVAPVERAISSAQALAQNTKLSKNEQDTLKRHIEDVQIHLSTEWLSPLIKNAVKEKLDALNRYVQVLTQDIQQRSESEGQPTITTSSAIPPSATATPARPSTPRVNLSKYLKKESDKEESGELEAYITAKDTTKRETTFYGLLSDTQEKLRIAKHIRDYVIKEAPPTPPLSGPVLAPIQEQLLIYSALDQLIAIQKAIRDNKKATGPQFGTGNLHKILSKMAQDVSQKLTPREKAIADLRNYIAIIAAEKKEKDSKSGKMADKIERRLHIHRSDLEGKKKQAEKLLKILEDNYENKDKNKGLRDRPADFKTKVQHLMDKNRKYTVFTPGKGKGRLEQILTEFYQAEFSETPKIKKAHRKNN